MPLPQDADELSEFWRRAVEGHRSLCSQSEHARLFAKAQGGALDAAAERLLALLP